MEEIFNPLKLEAKELNGYRLESIGLGHLSSNLEMGTFRMYLLARVKEEEGKVKQKADNINGARQDYLDALRILDNEGLYGDCLRLAQRLGPDLMIDEYEREVMLRMNNQVISSNNRCGIVDMYYPEGSK